MSVNYTLLDQDFTIKAENLEAANAACVAALEDSKTLYDAVCSRGENLVAEGLAERLVKDIPYCACFGGFWVSREVLAPLFKALAPYVERGSYLLWRDKCSGSCDVWIFDGECMAVEEAEVTYTWPGKALQAAA